MKQIVIGVLSFMLVSPLMSGQQVPANDAKLIDDHVFAKVTIKKEKIEAPSLTRVFRGVYYKAVPTYNHKDGTASCESYLVAVVDGSIVEPDEPNGAMTMEVLFTLLRSDFSIKTATDAKTFEEALDALYPLDWSENTESKKHFIREGKWYFIRGEFFESLKGFMVTTDSQGVIKSIDFDLEAIKGE